MDRPAAGVWTDGHPTAYRAVGYPAFLGGIYAVAGREPRVVRVVQAALDTATSLLLFLALQRFYLSGLLTGSIKG